MAILTTHGADLGDPCYVLLTGQSAFLLTISDALRAGVPYVHPSLLTDKERNRAHAVWRNRDLDKGRN